MTIQVSEQEYSVIYSAFADDGRGGEIYTDDPEKIIGWCAYARTEPDAGGEFDVVDELEFATEAEAEAAALVLSAKYSCGYEKL